MTCLMKKNYVLCSIFILLLVSGCGEGQDVDIIPSIEQEQNEFPTGNPIELLFDDVPAPEVPEFTWSLSAYSINGAEPIEVDILTPDPNWISNYLLTDTLGSDTQQLAALMDCQFYQYTFEITSLTTLTLGVSEPIGIEPDCLTNAPEGLLRGVFADFTNLIIEGQDEGTIEISNGDGTVLTLSPRSE